MVKVNGVIRVPDWVLVIIRLEIVRKQFSNSFLKFSTKNCIKRNRFVVQDSCIILHTPYHPVLRHPRYLLPLSTTLGHRSLHNFSFYKARFTIFPLQLSLYNQTHSTTQLTLQLLFTHFTTPLHSLHNSTHFTTAILHIKIQFVSWSLTKTW